MVVKVIIKKIFKNFLQICKIRLLFVRFLVILALKIMKKGENANAMKNAIFCRGLEYSQYDIITSTNTRGVGVFCEEDILH